MSRTLKDEGNDLFKSGHYEEALTKYIEGIKLTDISKEEKLNLFKNQSMCYMKLNQLDKALETCNNALELNRNDEKSLYRRSQIYFQQNQWKDAFTDAKQLIVLDPKNKLYQTNMKTIQDKLQAKVDEVQSYTGKVNSMFDLLSKTDSVEERVKCLNNLTVLARENNSDYIWKHENKPLIYQFCEKSQPEELIEAAQRCLSCLMMNSIEKSLEIFKTHGPQYFANMIYSSNEKHCKMTGHYLESILGGLTQLKAYKAARDKFNAEARKNANKMYPQLYPKYKIDESVEKYIGDIFTTLAQAVNNKKLSAAGRDSILEILLRFVPSSQGVGYSRKLMVDEPQNLQHLLEVGAASHLGVRGVSQLASNNISLIATTPRTKMTVALILAQLYDDLVSDQAREKFRDFCCDFVMDLLTDEILESKVEAANLIGVFFQGPYEVGNAVLSKAGIMEGLLLLLNTDVGAYRRIALDALVQATTKKDKCLSIVKDAVPILQEVYRSCGMDNADELAMKVRALVGLCKLGVAGGRDCSIKSMEDGSNMELSKCCRRLLASCGEASGQESDEKRKWAAEALAYLTLDAEVKQGLVKDDVALKCLLNCGVENMSNEYLYAVGSVLVNLTNSYDKQEIMPELIELAKYAHQHIPEQHQFDTEQQYVLERIDRLVSVGGLTAAMYRMTSAATATDADTNMDNCRELLARVYLAVVTEEKYRGLVIQSGGGKSVLSLSLLNTEPGRVIASQALAKLTITMDPRVAYPGQRSLEVIRPLINLLGFDNSALQNFEGLLGLTNLSSIDDAHRLRIFKEDGLAKIEHYMFEDHELLCRAATECMCNLVQLDEIRERFLCAENDRVKTMVLFCAEVEDPALIRAASGALASLSSDPRLLGKLTRVASWLEIMQILLAHDQADIQHRAVYILHNLMEHTSTDAGMDFCEYLVRGDTKMLEVLMALTKLEVAPDQEDRLAVIELAGSCLELLHAKGLIAPTH